MFYLLLAFGICVPLVILTALLWFSRLLSEELPQEDITGINVEPTKRNLFKRLRLWLMSSPKKLDYRRDKRGRFRRVRRG